MNIIYTAIAIIFSVPVAAQGAVVCAGKVSYLGADSAGEVVVAAGSAIVKICSTSSQGQFHTSVSGCKNYFATLLAARLSGRSVAIYYSSPTLQNCSEMQAWSAQPSAYFVELQE